MGMGIKVNKKLFQNILLLILAISVVAIYPFINNSTPNVYILQTPIDNLIPRIPAFVIIYILSLFVVGGIVLYSFVTNKYFRSVATIIIVIFLISYVFFIFFQTYIPRQSILDTDIFSFLLRFIYDIDHPFNGFPSLHSSLAVLIAFFFVQIRSKWMWLMIVFSISVVLSTLFVKQHYILDAISGVTLGFIVSFIVFRNWSPDSKIW